MEQKTDLADTLAVRSGSVSPTSRCPICLSLIDNPAFTDMCIHQFCYTCLCEWAKVKAVCPVCKQEFQTIAYNVQSYEKFDELSVKSLTVPEPCTRFQGNHTGFQISAILSHGVSQIHGHPQDARFRYRTTMTSDYRDVLRRLEEQRITEELRNPVLRLTVNHRPFVFSSNARKAVYRTGLRVQHLQTTSEQVFSLINPQFFNDNPACKIRLSPWLQRELDVMAELSDIPVIGDTMLLINLIFSLLNTLKITSQSFYNKLYPYFRRYTLHFLQELYCFARSAPYTMPQYDSCVVYGDGTSGAIWSEWHRDKARSNSSISTAIHDTTREDIINIPSDRGFISFVMRKHRRDANLSSATPVQGTSGMSATPHMPVDLVHEPSDSNSDVEVVGQEPPWNARRPIVISDSEEETTDTEQRFESRVDRELKCPVSSAPGEHQDQRTSKDPSLPGGSFVNEQRYHLSELSDESGLQESLHKSQKRRRENTSADERRDISDISVEENASYRFKTKRHQNSSNDWQNHYNRDSQNHAKKVKSKDRESQTSHSQEERSGHSKGLGKYFERSFKEQSASTERRKQYKHRSRERSRSYQRRHSKEQSRAPRRSHSKERVGTRRSLSRERSRVHRQSCSKERDSSYSRRLHREHRERHCGDRKLSCSSELPSCSFEKLDGYLKERQPLQYTKRKRRNSGQTYRCDSSETDAYTLSSNRVNVCEHSCVSLASNSQSSSISIPNCSNAYKRPASCRPGLVGEDAERDRELRLRTDGLSRTHSSNETNSDTFPSNVSHEDSSSLSKVATESSDLNDCSFVRKTYFWSDEEENSEDAGSSRSKTLKSQIGCNRMTGGFGASCILAPLSADEELIIIESSDCSSSNQLSLSKGYDTNETSYSHKSQKRKHWSRSCTSSKKSRRECEKEVRNVSTDSSAKESGCSLDSQQSKKDTRQRQTRYKKHKKERRDVDTDSRRQNKMKNHITNHMDVGLSTNRFDENVAQRNVSDVTDDGISHSKTLNVADELPFKKHFTGHKNSHLKMTKC